MKEKKTLIFKLLLSAFLILPTLVWSQEKIKKTISVSEVTREEFYLSLHELIGDVSESSSLCPAEINKSGVQSRCFLNKAGAEIFVLFSTGELYKVKGTQQDLIAKLNPNDFLRELPFQIEDPNKVEIVRYQIVIEPGLSTPFLAVVVPVTATAIAVETLTPEPTGSATVTATATVGTVTPTVDLKTPIATVVATVVATGTNSGPTTETPDPTTSPEVTAKPGDTATPNPRPSASISYTPPPTVSTPYATTVPTEPPATASPWPTSPKPTAPPTNSAKPTAITTYTPATTAPTATATYYYTPIETATPYNRLTPSPKPTAETKCNGSGIKVSFTEGVASETSCPANTYVIWNKKQQVSGSVQLDAGLEPKQCEITILNKETGQKFGGPVGPNGSETFALTIDGPKGLDPPDVKLDISAKCCTESEEITLKRFHFTVPNSLDEMNDSEAVKFLFRSNPSCVKAKVTSGEMKAKNFASNAVGRPSQFFFVNGTKSDILFEAEILEPLWYAGKKDDEKSYEYRAPYTFNATTRLTGLSGSEDVPIRVQKGSDQQVVKLQLLKDVAQLKVELNEYAFNITAKPEQNQQGVWECVATYNPGNVGINEWPPYLVRYVSIICDANNQYGSKVKEEEKFHRSQFLKQVPESQGGLQSLYSDVWFQRYLKGMGGSKINRPYSGDPKCKTEVQDLKKRLIEAAKKEIAESTLLMKDWDWRCFQEQEAKHQFNEGYGYLQTYVPNQNCPRVAKQPVRKK